MAARLGPLPEGTTLASLSCFPHGLPFYVRRPIVVLTKNGDELSSRYIKRTLSNDLDWPGTVVPLSRTDEWLATQANPVFVMTEERHRSALEALGAQRDLAISEIIPGWYGVLLSSRGR